MWSFLEEEVHKHAVRLFRLLCTINAVLVTVVTITDRILNSSSDMNHDYSSCLHFFRKCMILNLASCMDFDEIPSYSHPYSLWKHIPFITAPNRSDSTEK